MMYLHSAKIVHGDLKARNVLIGDDGRALVADFGLAEFERHDVIPTRSGTSSGSGEKTPRLIGTPHWLAPECFKDAVVDRKFADIWALGMTSYELYENGKVPLGHIAITDLSEKLESGERPAKPTATVPPNHIWKMMEMCWSLDTISRPNFSEITSVLGIFQEPDPETIREINKELTDGGIFR
ncbi:kinase-like protein, partial [Clavulina sp. PMI_390]